MNTKAIALTAALAFSTCSTVQAACAVTTPICGEGSKLCPHNMCTKPDGKCNLEGDGCLDIRWNRDGCLEPENTCGSGYCGTPPDFSDCFCDNGTCVAVGEKNTGEIPTVPAVVTTEKSVEATEAGVPVTAVSTVASITESTKSVDEMTVAAPTESAESIDETASIDITTSSATESTITEESNEIEEEVLAVDAVTELNSGAFTINSSLVVLYLFCGVAFFI